MVRTRAEGGTRKAVSAKAPRKAVGGSSSVGVGSSSSTPSSPTNSSNSGGNPVKWWPTPSWQKEISTFFKIIPCPDGSKETKDQSDVCKESSSLSSGNKENETTNKPDSTNGSVLTGEQENITSAMDEDDQK